MTQETLSLQYLQVNLADIAAGVQVTEEGLRQYYDETAADRNAVPERRRASHILVEAGSDPAKAKAEGRSAVRAGEGGRGFCPACAREFGRSGLEGCRWRPGLGAAGGLRQGVLGRAVRDVQGRDPRAGADPVRLPHPAARGHRAAARAHVRRSPRGTRARVPARAGAERVLREVAAAGGRGFRRADRARSGGDQAGPAAADGGGLHAPGRRRARQRPQADRGSLQQRSAAGTPEQPADRHRRGKGRGAARDRPQDAAAAAAGRGAGRDPRAPARGQGARGRGRSGAGAGRADQCRRVARHRCRDRGRARLRQRSP